MKHTSHKFDRPVALRLLALAALGGFTLPHAAQAQTISYANPALLQETAVSSTAGNSAITVANGANYAVGDVINFYGTTATTNPFGTASTLYYVTSVSGNTITVSTSPGGTALNAVNTTTASTTRLAQGLLTGSNWTGGTAPNSNTNIASFASTVSSVPGYVINGGNQTLYGFTYAGNGGSDISLISGANGTGYNQLIFATNDASTPKVTLGNSTTRLVSFGAGTGNLKLAVGGNQGLIFNSLGVAISSGSGLTAVSAAGPAKEIRLQNVDWSNFSGGVTVERGELRINATTGRLPNQTLTVGNAQTVTNNQIAAVNLQGFGSTVDGLNGNSLGRIFGGSTLTVGNANGSGDFGGVIGQNWTGATSATSLVKVGSGTQTISGNIVGTGTVGANAGTLILSGSNSYTGATSVGGGTLAVNGILGNTTTTVTTGLLRGSGTMAGAVNVLTAGTIGAGNSVGTLNTGALSLTGAATMQTELNIFSASSVTADLLNVTGNFSLDTGNTAVLSLTNLGSDIQLTLGTTITIVDYSGTWNGGTFSGLADDSTFSFGANTFQISYNGVDNLTSAVTLTSVVPEPGSVLLAGMGLMVVFTFRRRSGARLG